jgi:putative redox protein
MIEVKVKSIGNMQFVGKSASGHGTLMDTRVEAGGENTGPTPMELLLIALGGCTGMDVVSVLRKMQVEFSLFEIEIRGERSEEHPKVYKKIELVYRIKGNNVSKDKVKHAVELSQEKYCSVSAMLKSVANITYIIEIV